MSSRYWKAGWAGVAVPESAGGAGGSLADLAPIAEAVGARLASTMAVWSAGVVGPVLAGSGDPELVAQIAEGVVVPAIPVGSLWRVAAGVSVTDGTVSGQLRVLGPADGVVIVPLRVDGQESLAVIPADNEGVTVRVREPVDITRSVADVELAATVASRKPAFPPAMAPSRNGPDAAA